MTQHSTENPYTEQILNTYQHISDLDIDNAIDLAHQSFDEWQKTSIEYRCELLLELKSILEMNKQECADMITQEMGKPISAAVAEVEKCQWLCQHYAENAPLYLTDKTIDADYLQSFVTYQPLGVIFAVMPWNFPFWQVLRFAIPALTAGNAALLKHASASTGAGEMIAELFIKAGYPQKLFQHLIIGVDQCERVIANDHVRGVTLTGSERAGQSVASQAGTHLKKVVLELGGSDPYILLDDADIDLAAKQIVLSRLSNAGQVCIAAKRVFVQPHHHDTLIAKLKFYSKPYIMGDPSLSETKLGPMARKDLRDTLHQQIQDSVSKGAKILLGGVIPEVKGYFYPATILDQVTPGMPAFDEELFGPVISVISVNNNEEAIKLANQSPFGLGAAVFGEDVARAISIARNYVHAGACFVNQLVSSDPRLPFGGIKHSGFGRELSEEGIHEFCNVKTVAVSYSGKNR